MSASTTTTPAWLTSAESLLSAVSPTSTAVGDVAQFLTETEKLVAPSIAEATTQKYADQFQSDVVRSNQLLKDLLARPDDPAAERAVGSFVDGVLLDIGQPDTGGISGGPLIGLRVATLQRLLVGVLAERRDNRINTDLIAASKQSSAAK